MYIRLEDVQVMRCRIRLLFVIRQKGVKRSSLSDKRTRFAPISVTVENSRCRGGGLRCLAPTSVSHRAI